MENFHNLNIITNNIKWIQNKSKRLSIIETHSNTSDEGKWKDEFSGHVFYSHGTSNSCGVLITFFEKNKICVNSEITDKH